MATNHTANFSLSQWEADDPFIRTDFNADNARIDGVLHALDSGKAPKTDVSALSSAKADRAEVAALQQRLDSLTGEVAARGYVKAGVYTGNGKSVQFIDVGFPVAAVLIENQQGSRNSSSNSGTSGGLAVRGGSIYHGTTLASVSGTGFNVYNGGEYQGAFNREGGSYYFVAWG